MKPTFKECGSTERSGPKQVAKRLAEDCAQVMMLSIIQISAERGDQYHPFYRGIELPMPDATVASSKS